jgi:hypothetical protein
MNSLSGNYPEVMKRILLLLAASLASASLCPAATVAAWSFESPNVPPTVTGTTLNGLLPDVGSGTASGVHANAATTFTSGVGNGSASSLRADQWAAGDYWQFHVSTVGFAHIHLGFDMITSPGSSATNFTLAYSLDGTSFSTYNSNVAIRFGTWNASSPNPLCNLSFDLTSRTALDGAPEVYFRLTDNLREVRPTGTVSLDNVLITATAVPEPSARTLVGGAGALLWLMRRATGRNAPRPDA